MLMNIAAASSGTGAVFIVVCPRGTYGCAPFLVAFLFWQCPGSLCDGGRNELIAYPRRLFWPCFLAALPFLAALLMAAPLPLPWAALP